MDVIWNCYSHKLTKPRWNGRMKIRRFIF